MVYYNVFRMTEEEKKLADAYAKLNGVSLSEAIKRAFFEKIEDEYDIALADMALREYEKNLRPIRTKRSKRCLDYEVSGRVFTSSREDA